MDQKAAHSVLVRCPECKTAFVCLPELLKLKGGWLRCGACSQIFDGYQAIEEPLMRPSALKAADPPEWARGAGSLAPAPLEPLALAGPPPAAAPRVTARADRLAPDAPPEVVAPMGAPAGLGEPAGPAEVEGAPEPAPGAGLLEEASDIVAQLKESLEQGARALAEREERRQGALSPLDSPELAAVAKAESGRLLPPKDLNVEALALEADEIARGLFKEPEPEPGPGRPARLSEAFAQSVKEEAPAAPRAPAGRGALGALTPASGAGPGAAAGLLRSPSSDQLAAQSALAWMQESSKAPAPSLAELEAQERVLDGAGAAKAGPEADGALGASARRWDSARLSEGGAQDEPEFMRPRARLWPKAAAAGALALAAAGGAYVGRDALAAAAPASRPLLERVCELSGCSVAYEQREDEVLMQSADLKEVEGGSQLEFRAVVASQSGRPLKAPVIRLELLDDSGAVASRQEFAPKAWLGRDHLGPRQEAEARLRLRPLAQSAGRFNARLIWPSKE